MLDRLGSLPGPEVTKTEWVGPPVILGPVEGQLMDLGLYDKAAIVFGGADGIGAAVVQTLHAEGAGVAIADLILSFLSVVLTV